MILHSFNAKLVSELHCISDALTNLDIIYVKGQWKYNREIYIHSLV